MQAILLYHNVYQIIIIQFCTEELVKKCSVDCKIGRITLNRSGKGRGCDLSPQDGGHTMLFVLQRIVRMFQL